MLPLEFGGYNMTDSTEQIEVIDVRNQKISMEEIIEKQNKARGFDVTQIDKDKFIERIKWKDWSAYYLGKAFVSMYRPHVKAILNLTDTCNLDSEGLNFFFKIIFARDVPKWSDQYLYEIEQEVIEILGLEKDDDGLIKPTKSK